MLRAIIFDMDGVICDSEPLHMRAFQDVLRELGITLTDQEYYDDYLAFDDRGCFKAVLEKNGRPADPSTIKDLVDRKARYFDDFMKTKLTIYPGAESFVRKSAEKYMIALASGARRLEVEFVLRKAKIRGLFTAVVSSDDVEKGKPDPESFQKALESINQRRLHDSPAIVPQECLVIEDSKHGVAAAKTAGMRCLAVTTSFKADELQPADAITESLVGLSLDKLEKLFIS